MEGFGLNITPLRKNKHWHWRGAGSAEGNYCNSAKICRQTERSLRASASEWSIAGKQLYLISKYRSYEFDIASSKIIILLKGCNGKKVATARIHLRS